MTKLRRFSETVSTAAFGLVVIGGESDSRARHSSIEYYQGTQWLELAKPQLQISRHCAVSFDGKDIYIIGGHIEDQPFSNKVFLLNMPTKTIKELKGSFMKHGRQFHSCAVIDKDKIITVGGRDHLGFLPSVEVLNIGTLIWTEPKHLQLNTGIAHSQLISDSSGFFLK